ncbi:MAG TPA: tetratricopeptide repeat protein, partial [Kofleriaceae bacterium]|nr:tetratricopeptide repeat protein [Kofleriaceae bacterium]
DFDDLAAPPVAGARPEKRARAKETVHGKKSSRGTPGVAKSSASRTPSIDLDDEAIVEVTESPRADSRRRNAAAPGPGTAVRNAVAMPSGPIDAAGFAHDGRRAAVEAPTAPAAPGYSARPAKSPSAPPPMAPVHPPMPLGGPPPAPLPPAPVPRLAAAMPTVAALPPPGGQYSRTMPAMPPPANAASVAAAARPTVAIGPGQPLTPMQLQSAAAVDAVFGGAGQPAWAQATAHAGNQHHVAAVEPTARPSDALDPALIALMSGSPAESGVAVAVQQPAQMKTGVRKMRSKLQLAVWILVGVVVIGGGVFAGFKIRAMRLDTQIARERDHASGLAKADTWLGWTAARDSLAKIAAASPTGENRAALARARALIAFEFGDGLADAQAAVDSLGGQGGLDGDLAAAYLALASHDLRAAKIAADAARSSASQDPDALYVAGQAALAEGDVKGALLYLQTAAQKDPRPLYGVGYARALAAAYSWDDAIATLDKVLKDNPDHPAAVLERASVLAASGRIGPGVQLGLDVHGQLDKLVAEGTKPALQQTRGVSPAQVAFVNLALARVDYARGDLTTAHGDLRAAAGVGFDDQGFAEDAIDTLYAIGDLDEARGASQRALQAWPTSRRARLTLAQALIAQGKPSDALDVLAKQPEVIAMPLGQAVRGQARLAVGDVDGARADFDAALKKLPNLEPALIGLAGIEIAAGDADSARQLIEPHVAGTALTAGIATAYAATLRQSADPAQRGKAKTILEKVVNGPPGPDVSRAQLELARIDRDLGDFHGARAAYAEAIKTGNFDARLENGLVAIEDRDAVGGHETLEALLKDSGDKPPPNLQLEVARARMLVGDNAGAQQLLDLAAQSPTVAKWKLDRERGRLALRRGDLIGAATALGRAIDGCGSDAETFLLSADAATSDAKEVAALAEKVRRLAPDRLKGQPEASVVTGKLAIAASKWNDAEAAFKIARDQLEATKASDRRQAQAAFGTAVAKYNQNLDIEATQVLELAVELDPALYTAYLYRALMLTDRQPKRAFELAQKAVQLDPDSVDGWAITGSLAAKLGDKKVLGDAIARLTAIAPTSPQLRQLQAMRR